MHEDEEVISRDFKQQLRMERLRWPEVSGYTGLAENIKIIKQSVNKTVQRSIQSFI